MTREELDLRTNATLRLHNYLYRLSRHSPNSPLADVLPVVLDVATEDKERSLFKSFAVLHRMLELSQAEISRYFPDDIEFRLQHFSAIRIAVSPRFAHENWSNRRLTIRPEYLTGLEYSGRDLRKFIGETTLDEESSARLDQAVSDLQSAVEELRVDSETYTLLRTRAAAIRDAFDEYRFWGATELNIGLESVAVAAAANRNKLEESAPDKWKNLLEKLQVLALIIQMMCSPVAIVVPLLTQHSASPPIADESITLVGTKIENLTIEEPVKEFLTERADQ